MERIAVTSSNVRSVGYDPATQTLEVEFMSGDVYQYARVPADVHLGLVTAPSIGSFLATSVKHKFAFTKMPKMPKMPPGEGAADAQH